MTWYHITLSNDSRKRLASLSPSPPAHTPIKGRGRRTTASRRFLASCTRLRCRYYVAGIQMNHEFGRNLERNVMTRTGSVALTSLMLMAFAGPCRAVAQENTRIRDVVYGRKFGMALTMDVWKPAKQNGAGVIFLVSGGFQSEI